LAKMFILLYYFQLYYQAEIFTIEAILHVISVYLVALLSELRYEFT